MVPQSPRRRLERRSAEIASRIAAFHDLSTRQNSGDYIDRRRDRSLPVLENMLAASNLISKLDVRLR